MIAVWWATAALGCGGMFGPEGAEVFSAGQQVIFERGDGEVAVDYRVDYGGGLLDFGWVVPIPGEFVALEEGDDDRFESLWWDTTPFVDYHGDPDRGCGCGATKGDALGGSRNSTSYTIVGQGRAGVFEYTALAATDSAALIGWLDEHGWTVGPSGPAIDAYVAEGGWQFVAISLAEDAGVDTSDGGHSVARIRYAGDALVFPARMSRYSTAPEQKTTLYVLGDQAATMSGWQALPFPDISEIGFDLDTDQRLRDLGGDTPTYAVMYADSWDGQWLTRFDTVTASADHDADVVLALDGGTDPVHPTIDLYESEDAMDDGGCATGGNPTGALPWAIALLVAAGARTGRPGSPRTRT